LLVGLDVAVHLRQKKNRIPQLPQTLEGAVYPSSCQQRRHRKECRLTK